eukprot:g2843.t1
MAAAEAEAAAPAPAAAEGEGQGELPSVVFMVAAEPSSYEHQLYGIAPTMTVADVRAALGTDLGLEAERLSLHFGEMALSDDAATMASLGLECGPPGGDGQQGPPVYQMVARVEPTEAEAYRMPDEIDVDVEFDNGQPPRRIRVKIERDERRKLYLGGYRNRKTGLVYHHSWTQTLPQRRDWSDVERKSHRETQTAVTAQRSQQTTREGGTQMTRPDLLLDESGDREVAARSYFSSEMLSELRLSRTVVLQCHWRSYVARCRAAALREARAAARAAAEEAERARAEEAAEKHKREVERRMHPRSAADFEVLYNELEAWRAHETERINAAGYEDRERLAALAQLLHKETKLLQTIDRLKLSASQENHEERVQQALTLMAAPKRWQMSDGDALEVHTPFTTRANELLELYRGLTLDSLTMDERLDVLLHVKWTVKEFDCNLTREIVDLIDREADLLNRGRGSKTLDGLRKRTANLFLQFIETPEFNPESTRLSSVPRELMLRQNVQPITSSQAQQQQQQAM